jgi:mycothiol system anti-sigma-R factor
VKQDCREVLEKLYLILDRELPEGEFQKLKTHLADCPPCFERIRVEERFKEMVHVKCAPGTAPPDLVDKIRRRLREV